MKAIKKAVSLSVVTLGLAGLLAGCGGPDNESGALTNTDGTKTQIINSGGGGGMSPEEYTKKAAGEAGKNLMQEKGYPGAKKK
ncbi:MAG: hypothetical protein U0794_12520 [Isosphaeraceae bacterium]